MRARGYTLIELVVALAISLIGVAAGMTLLIGSQQWFQTGSDERAMQETARMALDELQSSLRSAGYGLEPTMVFDMGILATTAQDRAAGGRGPGTVRRLRLPERATARASATAWMDPTSSSSTRAIRAGRGACCRSPGPPSPSRATARTRASSPGRSSR